MTTYYMVLEVPEWAAPDDIRRAYRRLVLLTHPDRTPDPAAHRRYLAINEAYDTLSNPSRRATYDARLHALRQPRPPEPAVPLHRDPALRRRGYAQPATRPPAASKVNQYENHFRRFAPWLRGVARLALVVIVVAGIDLARTQVLPHEIIREFEYVERQGRYSSASYFIASTQHTHFKVASTTRLKEGSSITVYQTPWFRKIRRVSQPPPKFDAAGPLLPDAEMREQLEAEILPDAVDLIPSNFVYAWLLLVLALGSAAWTLYPSKKAEHTFNAGFVASASLLLLVVYLFFM